MSSMNCTPRRGLCCLILVLSFSPGLLAAPLITHPLGVSTGERGLLEVASGGSRFSLTTGLSGSATTSLNASNGTAPEGSARH